MAGEGGFLFLGEIVSRHSPQTVLASSAHGAHGPRWHQGSKVALTVLRQTVVDKQGGSGSSKPQGRRGFSSLLGSGCFHSLLVGSAVLSDALLYFVQQEV